MPATHGMGCVRTEVDKNLVNLDRINQHQATLLIYLFSDDNGTWQSNPHKFHHFFDNRVHVLQHCFLLNTS